MTNLLKKVLKIKEGLDSAYHKYQEAVKTDDEIIILKYLREFSEYLLKHRKLFQFSEEEINGINKTLNEYEEAVIKVQKAGAAAAEAHRNYEETKGKFFEEVLKQPPSGRKRTKH